jgi:hypothetical protein
VLIYMNRLHSDLFATYWVWGGVVEEASVTRRTPCSSFRGGHRAAGRINLQDARISFRRTVLYCLLV